MAQILLFQRIRREPEADASKDSNSAEQPNSPEKFVIPPHGELIEWCLMILAQTDESDLSIPITRSYSPNTVYEVICHFAPRGWLVTTDGPRALNFRRK